MQIALCTQPLNAHKKILCTVVGDDETETKLHLQEEMISDLKQQMAIMQRKIEDLKSENEELKGQRSPAPIKEGIYMSCT